MSLYLTLAINDDAYGSVTITREHDDNGTDRNAVNDYRWTYDIYGKQSASGTVKHRYGNGAAVLVYVVMSEIAGRDLQLAAVVDYAEDNAIGGDA